MFDVLAGLLAFFYSVVHSYTFAIAMLTLTVMVVLAPLTIKSTRSMLALQRLQPAIKKLQQQHKGDRQALNEAMMAFYKEHKINPLGGCLPMLLQMPVFIIMYRVIHGLIDKDGPKYVSHSTDLYQSLVNKGGRMVEWGFDLGKSASNVKGGFGEAFPYYVLVALVVATGFVQARQMSSRQTSQANPQAQMIQRVFPIMFGVISLNIPAGVVIYFITSNLFRIVQQALMYRYDPQLSAVVQAEVKEVEAKAAEVQKGSPARATNNPGQNRNQGNRNRSRNKKKRRGR